MARGMRNYVQFFFYEKIEINRRDGLECHKQHIVNIIIIVRQKVLKFILNIIILWYLILEKRQDSYD